MNIAFIPENLLALAAGTSTAGTSYLIDKEKQLRSRSRKHVTGEICASHNAKKTAHERHETKRNETGEGGYSNEIYFAGRVILLFCPPPSPLFVT